MEFLGSILLVIVVFGGVGKFLGELEISKKCDTDGTFKMNKTVYECKPVAVMVDGKAYVIKKEENGKSP
jgi:hypothetical protein